MPKWTRSRPLAMEIYILRHGIAETARAGVSDADRVLVPQGKKKLEAVLRVARAAGASPALILTSPLRRAMETAEVAARVLGHKAGPVSSEALLPGCTPEETWKEIRSRKAAQQLLIVGHEPHLGYLLGFLLGAPTLLADFKKAALVRIDVEQLGTRPQGVLRWFLTPKLAESRP